MTKLEKWLAETKYKKIGMSLGWKVLAANLSFFISLQVDSSPSPFILQANIVLLLMGILLLRLRPFR